MDHGHGGLQCIPDGPRAAADHSTLWRQPCFGTHELLQAGRCHHGRVMSHSETLVAPHQYVLLVTNRCRCNCQILVGNKSDMADEKRAVPYAKGKALADEYNIRFFETSAKDNLNVEEVGWEWHAFAKARRHSVVGA